MSLKWSVALILDWWCVAELDPTALPEVFALALKSEFTGTGKWSWIGELFLKQPFAVVQGTQPSALYFTPSVTPKGCLWHGSSMGKSIYKMKMENWLTSGFWNLKVVEQTAKAFLLYQDARLMPTRLNQEQNYLLRLPVVSLSLYKFCQNPIWKHLKFNLLIWGKLIRKILLAYWLV